MAKQIEVWMCFSKSCWSEKLQPACNCVGYSRMASCVRFFSLGVFSENVLAFLFSLDMFFVFSGYGIDTHIYVDASTWNFAIYTTWVSIGIHIYMYMCNIDTLNKTCTRTHTCTHAQSHTFMRVHIYVCVHVQIIVGLMYKSIRMSIHLCIYTCTGVYIYICMYINIYIFTYMCIFARIYTYSRCYSQTSLKIRYPGGIYTYTENDASIYIWIHTHIHVCLHIHTYACMCIHTYMYCFLWK